MSILEVLYLLVVNLCCLHHENLGTQDKSELTMDLLVSVSDMPLAMVQVSGKD